MRSGAVEHTGRSYRDGMPVLVTGAEAGLGASVIDHLSRTGGELRAFLDATTCTDDDIARVRTGGCKVAIGELDDEGHLEAALEQVHTVAHCWTGPLHSPAEQLEAAAALASAALGAHVRRLIWVRDLARPEGNPYLEAGAQIAALFEDLPIETVMLSTAVRHSDDDPFTIRLAAGWLSGTPVDQATPHAPISNDDVARAIAAADRQRGDGGELHLRLALVGPEVVPLRDVLRRLGGRARRLGAPAHEAASPEMWQPPPAWLVDWLSRPAHAVPENVDGPAIQVAQGAAHLPMS